MAVGDFHWRFDGGVFQFGEANQEMHPDHVEISHGEHLAVLWQVLARKDVFLDHLAGERGHNIDAAQIDGLDLKSLQIGVAKS
jgi:hypothetical protein